MRRDLDESVLTGRQEEMRTRREDVKVSIFLPSCFPVLIASDPKCEKQIEIS
jgi:hypothetical protein